MELWNSSNEFMKEFEMQPLLSIDEVTPLTTRIIEVEEHKKIIQVSIQSLTHIGKESLEEHLLRPSRLIIKIQQFVKSTVKELQQEVSAKVCSGELIIERSQSGKLEDIMKDYSLWEEYQNQIQDENIS
jgi:hypothetical protein